MKSGSQQPVVLIVVSAVSLLWATGITAMFLGVVPTPSFLRAASVESPVQMEAGLSEYEAVAFTREFLERYLSFDPSNFRSSQTAGAFLMTTLLRERRLQEVDRLDEKVTRSGVQQKATLRSLRKRSDRDAYEAELQVSLNENKTVSEFWTRATVALRPVERSIENPWGFLVEDFAQEVIAAPVTKLDTVSLKAGTPIVLRFPCAIENVELPKGTPLRVKLTTRDISELQVRTEAAFNELQSIRATCRDRAFAVSFKNSVDAGDRTVTVMRVFNLAESTSTAKPPRRKSAVEKTLEQQLGFIVEDK